MANIHIERSSRMSRRAFLSALPVKPYHDVDDAVVMTCRSECSLLREWAAHKLLYHLGMFRSHTESVDLNYPQSCLEKVGYFVVGNIALIFYK